MQSYGMTGGAVPRGSFEPFGRTGGKEITEYLGKWDIVSPIKLGPVQKIPKIPKVRVDTRRGDHGARFNDNDRSLVAAGATFHAWVIQSYQDGVSVAQIASQGSISMSAVQLHLQIEGINHD